MARLLDNLSDEPIQRHTILFGDSEIVFTIRFYPKESIWCGDVTYQGFVVKGFKLSAGTLHIRSCNLPFDFIITDNSGNGLDPFRRNDFQDGRCSILLLEETEMEAIRGIEVP